VRVIFPDSNPISWSAPINDRIGRASQITNAPSPCVEKRVAWKVSQPTQNQLRVYISFFHNYTSRIANQATPHLDSSRGGTRGGGSRGGGGRGIAVSSQASGGVDSRSVDRLVSGSLLQVLGGVAESRVVFSEQAESRAVPGLSRGGKVLGLEQSLGAALVSVVHQLGVQLLVSVRDNLESASLLVDLVGLLPGVSLLSRVQVLEGLSSGGLVRLLRVVGLAMSARDLHLELWCTHSVSDLEQLLVSLIQSGSDGGRDGGLDSLLDDAGGGASDKLVKQIVLGVSDGPFEGVNVNLDVVDLEDSVSSTSDTLNLDINGHTLARDDNVGETVVRKLGESSLLSERKGDVSDVGLGLRGGDSEERVRGLESLLDRRVRAELDSLVGLNLDNVGDNVGSREDQVLDDQVDLVVRVLGSRNGDVTDSSNNLGENLGSNVLPQLGLEGEVALLVEEQVLGEPLDVVTETLVERVIGEGGEPELDLVGQSLLVSPVLLGEEVLSGLSELLALLLAVILEDVAGLEQASSDKLVEVGEPVSEVRVVLGVGVDLVESLDDVVHGLSVGESLEESSELESRVGDSGVRLELVGSVGALVGDVLGVAVVVLESVEEPGHLE
jgi:hypothetical protein